MTQAEETVLKALAHEFVDQGLPAIIADLEAKLPAAWAPMISVIVAALEPSIVAQLDALIEAKI